jgi:Domain of unknown function (DUF4396)
MLVWFALTGLSVAFVSIDIRSTPAHPVIKWAFVILALFAGPFAAFFYVLGCREPLEGTHEVYVAVRWRQVLASTMHCAAGDGIGIIAGAAFAASRHLPMGADFALEYALGFGFGWAIFQAFAMRDMAGGDYPRSLRQTFLPEFLSMNLLMAGMVVTKRFLMPYVDGSADPLAPGFWFVMSMALIVGFIFAFPINWWLVAKGLKHGMITVRRESRPSPLLRDLADGHARHAATPQRFACRKSFHDDSHSRRIGPRDRLRDLAWVSKTREQIVCGNCAKRIRLSC